MSRNRLKDVTEAVAQPFHMVKNFISHHPYSCYMLAAIEYNNALFHIFSGPLFANVQGYVYLDLIIWGISPLIYLLFRPTLFKMIKPAIPTQKIAAIDQTSKLIEQIKKHKQYLIFIHKRRLCFLITFSIAIFISFLFMNYSQTFNWNYFTRIINMDLGYLIFDFACRSMQLIVEIQEDEEIQEKYNRCHTQFQFEEMKQTALKVQKCRIYCKFKNMAMFLSYAVVFFLFANGFDVSLRYSGQQVLAFTSIISCLITFVIPVLYFFHFKKKYFQKWARFESKLEYKALDDQQDKQDKYEKQDNNNLQINDQISEEIDSPTYDQIQKEVKKIKRIICKANKPCSPPTHRHQSDDFSKSTWSLVKFVAYSNELRRPMTIFTLVFFSAVINISYLALWIMQTLKHEQNYVQYNQTLLISAVFLMIGSILFGIASKINLNYPFQIGNIRKQEKRDQNFTIGNQILNEEDENGIEWGYYINKVFLFMLGVILLLAFNLIKDNIYMFILSTIGMGFHLALLNYLYFKVEKVIQQVEIEIDLDILSLHLQTIAYLVVPVIITITQTTDFTYPIYGYMSSITMVLASVLM